MTLFEDAVLVVLRDICAELKEMRLHASTPYQTPCERGEHPEDQWEDRSTFGLPAGHCKACGYSVGMESQR